MAGALSQRDVETAHGLISPFSELGVEKMLLGLAEAAVASALWATRNETLEAIDAVCRTLMIQAADDQKTVLAVAQAIDKIRVAIRDHAKS